MYYSYWHGVYCWAIVSVPSAPLDVSAELVNSTAISRPPLSPNDHNKIMYYEYKPPEVNNSKLHVS